MRKCIPSHFLQQLLQRLLQRLLHRSYTAPTAPTKTQRFCTLMQKQHIPFLSSRELRVRSSIWVKRNRCHVCAMACVLDRVCRDLLTTSLQSGDKTMPPEHMQNSLGCLCLRVQSGIPSRPERKKRPLYIIPTHPLAAANRPLPCNVGGFGIPSSNKKGTIFSHRETCPQLGSAGNQHCIDWGCGGAARRGWMGTFFSLGTDSGAMVLHCYLRVCGVEHGCCVRQADCKRELPMGATHLV